MWPRHHHPDSEHSVAAASVRLLTGEAVDLFNESGLDVPAWARVNTLAHTAAESLARLSAPNFFRSARRWDAVTAYLAAEVLAVSRRQPEKIAWIQQTVLIPLELALLAGEIEPPETPGRLASVVMDALRTAGVADP